MAEKIIVFLGKQNPTFIRVNGDHFEKIIQQNDVSAIAALVEDKEVQVLVPSEDVLLTSAKIPKMNRSKLMQALPFALEEQLISEVEQLHFATGDFQDGSLPVAIVAHEKIQQWLSVLQSWQIKADVLYPDVFALPVEENIWHIVIKDIAIVRTGSFSGFACDKKNLNEMLALVLTEKGMPTEIKIQNYSNENFSENCFLDAEIKEIITEELKENTNLHYDLAKNLGQIPFINLLQNTYHPKKSKFPHRSKLWKSALTLSIIWGLLLFSYPITSYFILKQRVDLLQNEISQIYKRNFPQATSLVAPKQRMESKLQKLSAEGSENHLLLLLGKIGKAMSEIPNIKINRFDFQNNQLNLDVTAAASEDFSAFTEFLQSQSLRVKQQNANLIGTRINATLSIE